MHCVKVLRDKLNLTAELATDLQITVTRQDKRPDDNQGGGAPTGEKPLVFNAEASEVAWIMTHTLEYWTFRAAMNPTEMRQLLTADDALRARWLSRSVLLIARLEDADDAYDELVTLTELTLRAVDIHTRRYLGPCMAMYPDDGGFCTRDLYATGDQVTVTCPACTALTDVDTRRRTNQQRMRAVLYTAAQLEAALGELYGIKVRATRIRVWASRDPSLIRGQNRRGDNVFRLGDILDKYLAHSIERSTAA
ncbi:hypothetical protein [Rhodococcus opacus]|nr:hypothetical protein [Rhodococcus opacus]